MRLSENGSAKTDPGVLTNCTVCPRNCYANRFSENRGYCNAGAGFEIASICAHKGEEPPISGLNGICNVFFYRCNLQCIYCQNCQISTNSNQKIFKEWSLAEVLDRICSILDSGCKALGFVSPSHMIPQMIAITEAVKKTGRNPVIIYNTNAYDKVDVLKSLEGIVDVYLPDLKYADAELAKELSDASDYPLVAQKAIAEMYRQKGAPLITDADGQAISGLIIRHLVLPGQVNNSMNVLRFIANDISTKVHISLMSQYNPVTAVIGHRLLGRSLSEVEYEEVVAEMEKQGLDRGWIQALESTSNYLPDFCYEHPFEKKVK